MYLNSFSLPHDMLPAGEKPVRFIAAPEALLQCLQELAVHDTIAFDLEFDSHNYSYGVTLCLVQVATPDACYVIDPLALNDLQGLYAVFADERIQKIVHAPGEDLRLLHSLGCYPKNLFDTEVVAKLLNYEQTSLAAMLQEIQGCNMSKQQQKSNWLRRPLTPEQVRYAADDVASLHALRAALEAKAQKCGLMPYVREEQEALSTTIYRTEVKDYFLKPADAHTMSPRQQYVLNALFRYRDELARRINKPAHYIMGEDIVRALAAGTMQPGDIAAARGVYRSFQNSRFAAQLSGQIDDIRAAALHLSDALPARQRLSAEQHAAREQANRDKAEKFAPVQEALAQRFGIHAARLLLSNAAVNELLLRHTTLRTLKYRYRQQLIRSTAKDLGINLSGYE